MLFQRMLRAMIREGTLRLITADGRVSEFGNKSPPVSAIKLHKRSLEWTLALNPKLKVGEAYMDGTLTIEEGTLRDFLNIVMLNMRELEKQKLHKWLSRIFDRTKKLKQFNPIKKAKRNVEYHYDLSPQLYDLFLDSDRQYSCGYFSSPFVSLEQAQLDKKRHIAAKLFINRSGLKVLDIGSGWGGLGLYLAKETGCDVTGVTLSSEQLKTSRERARSYGLDKTCNFKLEDYRLIKEKYDRIVSVGMFEHVGKKNYDEFFAKISDLLDDDGVCLLHSIGSFEESFSVNPFIQKHIFPGTDLPSLSEVLRCVERSGLFVADLEVLRIHYAETLKIWNERFQANRDKAVKIYDERFCRKWEFYLIGCEMSFRHGHLMVFQLQLSKRLGTLPLTRDYIHDWEDIERSMSMDISEQQDRALFSSR